MVFLVIHSHSRSFGTSQHPRIQSEGIKNENQSAQTAPELKGSDPHALESWDQIPIGFAGLRWGQGVSMCLPIPFTFRERPFKNCLSW